MISPVRTRLLVCAALALALTACRSPEPREPYEIPADWPVGFIPPSLEPREPSSPWLHPDAPWTAPWTPGRRCE